MSFEEISRSSYIENNSLICEILVEKLCGYYQMIPSYFEFAEKLATLEVAYNIKKTFPVLSYMYLEFRDYIYFFNKVCNTFRSFKLIETMKVIFFNNFLIDQCQANLLSIDLKIKRSHLQYLIFILKSIKHNDIVHIIFYFLMGFDDSRTNFVVKNQDIEGTDIDNTNKDQFNETFTQADSEDDRKSDTNRELGFNYYKHDNIALGVSLFKNMTNTKEIINVIIFVLFETLFEKCPFLMMQRLVLPFAELCIRQMEDPDRILSSNKVYPDTTYFCYLISIYEKKNFDINLIADNVEYNTYRCYNNYMSNDIDFYYHYQNRIEDYQSYQWLAENPEDVVYQTPEKEQLLKMPSDMKTSISKISVKFNYFSTIKQKINLNPKLFDELTQAEEEFNNIYVRISLNYLRLVS